MGSSGWIVDPDLDVIKFQRHVPDGSITIVLNTTGLSTWADT